MCFLQSFASECVPGTLPAEETSNESTTGLSVTVSPPRIHGIGRGTVEELPASSERPTLINEVGEGTF